MGKIQKRKGSPSLPGFPLILLSFQICKIKYARLQGLKALKQHFRSSIVMNQQVLKILVYIELIIDIIGPKPPALDS